MNRINFWLLGLLFMGLNFVSCEKDDDVDVVVDEAEVLVEYLESANSPLQKDYVNSDLPSIMLASDVRTLNATGDVYIVDIRYAEDFAAGHIPNAHNVVLSNILTHLDNADLSGVDKIAVVCYTGQTAGYATSLLRLLGYDNAFSMKWGMSSWHEDFAGKWKSNIGNAYATQFTTESNPKGAEGELPELSTGLETGQDILEARVNTLLTSSDEGFGAAKITNQAVVSNPDNYYIINYWPQAHYEDPGHIPGAIQYTPKESLALNTDLTTLPTDKTIVVYCYTGQTSAFLTAYLRLLGYDAKSLLFGANGMIYNDMAPIGHRFSDGAIMGYEYE